MVSDGKSRIENVNPVAELRLPLACVIKLDVDYHGNPMAVVPGYTMRWDAVSFDVPLNACSTYRQFALRRFACPNCGVILILKVKLRRSRERGSGPFAGGTVHLYQQADCDSSRLHHFRGPHHHELQFDKDFKLEGIDVVQGTDVREEFANPATLQAFERWHPDAFTEEGELKREVADLDIAALSQDELAILLAERPKQTIDVLTTMADGADLLKRAAAGGGGSRQVRPATHARRVVRCTRTRSSRFTK